MFKENLLIFPWRLSFFKELMKIKIATSYEMRKCDEQAINNYGIPGIILMENAGLEVVRRLDIILNEVNDKNISIIAGKGNNGGDGYVIARHLFNKGAKVKVFLLGDKEDVSGDALVNLNILESLNIEVTEVKPDSNERVWDKFNLAVKFSCCVIDAVFGIGFKGTPDDYLTKAINIINNYGNVVVAVDIPTGVNADTGNVTRVAVKADYTVTFGLLKTGLLFYPGADFSGEVFVADISIPKDILEDENIKQNVVTDDFIKSILPKRRKNSHKGSNGKVAVAAGSKQYPGAAFLTATGALRSGAGLITLLTPEKIRDVMAIKLTEVMTKPVKDTFEGAFSVDSIEEILDFSKECNVLAIGPGIGRSESTEAVVKAIIKEATCPLVIDADGISALEDDALILNNAHQEPVLTPHIREMARLTGLSDEEIIKDKLAAAKRFAAYLNSIIVLKGAHTIIAFPEGDIYINNTGNEGLATGGTGDVLTGIIAGFIAQGLSSRDAAIAGVYIHGLAADIVAQKGVIGLSASDVLEAIPTAILTLKS